MARNTTRRSKSEDVGRPGGRRQRGARIAGRGRSRRTAAAPASPVEEAVAATVAQDLTEGEARPPVKRERRSRKVPAKPGPASEPAAAGAGRPVLPDEPARDAAPRPPVQPEHQRLERAGASPAALSAAAARPGEAAGKAAADVVDRSTRGRDGGQQQAAAPIDFGGVSRRVQEEAAALVREQLADTSATTRQLMTCTSVPAAMSIQVEAAVRTVARFVAHGHAMAALGRDLMKSLGARRRGGP